MSNDLSSVLFDDIFKNLRLTNNNLKKCSEAKFIEEIIAPLYAICNSVGTNKPYKPMFVPEEYVRQWEAYLAMHKKPDMRALRYLCWKPDIASDKRFFNCLDDEQISLSARSLQGIVRACHLRWISVVKESIFEKGSLLEIVKDLVKKYQGSNRILQKWNDSLDTILSPKGPALFATDMIKAFKTIKDHSELWTVDVQSEFFKDAMIQAVQTCIYDSNRCQYLFSELLTWQLWNNSTFKEIVGKLILDRYYKDESPRNKLQNFILSDKNLGDPRLPRNKRNWLDMNSEACKQFIQWLSIEDIGFFFEHVLPDRKDPHERKSFWLRYVPKLKSSRPLLCFEDETRLHPLLRDKTKVGHFGKIRGINSAFILDFGQVKAVEFSRVGACYIYTESEFDKIVPDLWSGITFTEQGLKDKDHCIDKIRHLITYNVDWRRNVMNILAKHGVRL
jgi:hypothetical protein